jgi:hypothetical protein
MAFLARLLSMCTVALALLAATAVACRSGLVDFGLDLSDLPELMTQLQHHQERGATIDSRLRETLARLRAKEAIARQLIEGRLTLLEGAQRLGELPGALSDWAEMLPAQERGSSPRETYCRHLIGMVQASLSSQPNRARAVLARLEAELREHLRRGVALP